jgi:hypothetical protein
MKSFFRSMNLARAMILLSVLGALVLAWTGWRSHSRVEEMRRNVDTDMSKLSTQLVELARKHTQLTDSKKGENLQGETDLQSYIYKIAGMDRVEVGNMNLTQSEDPFTKGTVDKKIMIRPDNRERTFRRTTLANFLYTLEQQSRRVKVTMVKLEVADRRLKPEGLPEDLWLFEAEVTSRQRLDQ